MADGKLIFPIRFDLSSAVRAASGDIDKVLRELQTSINARPLSIKPTIADKDLQALSDKLKNLDIPSAAAGSGKNRFVAEKGSIVALNVAMDECIQKWNKLAESERIVNRETGEYSEEAKKIIERFSALTAASETYAKSLQQIVRESKRAADEEIKHNQKTQAELDKRLQKSRDTVAMLNTEETSIAAVAAKMKYYTQIIQSSDFGTKKYKFASERLEQLGAQYQRLQELMSKATGNKGKDQFGFEKLKETLRGPEQTLDQVKAKLKAINKVLASAPPESFTFRRMSEEAQRLIPLLNEMERKRKEAMSKPLNMASISLMPEKTLSDMSAKIQAYRNLMQNSDFGSRQFNQAMFAANQLASKLDLMNKTVSDVEKWRTFQQALKSSASTIEGLNSLVSVWQSRMQSLNIGTPKWIEAAGMVARYSQELQRATQYAQDFHQKAFQGLPVSVLQNQMEQTRQLRIEIQNCDEAYNRLNASGKAVDGKGSLTSAAVKIIQDKAVYTKMLAEVTLDSDKALQKYEESERKAAQAAKQRADALKKMRDALNANEQRLAGLNEKLQVYQSLIQKQQVGSAAWNKSALEIRRLSDELNRANQRLQDFQAKSFKGVSGWLVEEQVQKLQMLRAEIQSIDSALHANRQMTDSGRGATLSADAERKLLDERIAKTKQINEILKSASDLQLERERKITEETEKRKKLLEDMRRKEKEHDATKGERRALAIAEQRRKAAGLLTKEQEKRQRMLNAEENTVNAIQQKLSYYRQKLNGQVIDSVGFQKTAAEIDKLTKKLEEAQRKIDALTGKTTTGAGKQEQAYNRVSEAMRKQTTYVERLVQRMAIYASFSALGNFLSRVREVTAQFELQRVSLGAIIQDQNRANQLFSEIKQFALKSPVSIFDMTKYTKQVAAYRIETEKLFDTTKRLADVSVGLGVDMGRIVLAYGQVRAASYLRAAEIRQFTEAGIPMLELLSEKLTKLNGELVSTEQVMDLVSKRGIDFKMVEEIFNDMTSAGGMFYNMQERQGNTLYGMWAKLGDAASMMYDSIGNTGVVNSAMKGFIELSTDLMRNWKASAAAGLSMGAVMAAILIYNKAGIAGAKQKEMADQKAAAATERRKLAQDRLYNAQRNGTLEDVKTAKASLQKAEADERAALAAQKRAQSTSALKAGLQSFAKSFGSMIGWGVAITAVSTLIYKIKEAYDNAHRLKDALDETWSETSVLQSQSVRNFETLVSKALGAADGSKTQKDALDELNRTYKDMLPEEALKIENLRKMKGDYESLTQAVREYIAAQQQKKALNTINEEEGTIQTKMQKKLRDVMMNKDLGDLALDEAELGRFWANFEKTALDTSKSVKEQFIEAFRLAALNGAEEMWNVVKKKNKDVFTISGGVFVSEETLVNQRSAIGALSQSIARMNELIGETSAKYAAQTENLGEYTALMQEYNQYVDSHLNSGETFLQNQENVNMRIVAMESMIRNALSNLGIAWKDEWANIVESVDPANLNHLSFINMQEIISAIDPNQHPDLFRYIQSFQKIYNGLIPQNSTVQQIRAKLFQIAESTGAGMDVMRRFLWDGSGNVDEHLKKLKEQIAQYKASLKEMQTAYSNMGIFGTLVNALQGDKIKETEKILKALEEHAKFVETYTVPKENNSGSGNERDGRVQTLMEIVRALREMNQRYKEYVKLKGKANADDYLSSKVYKEELAYLNEMGKQFGLKFNLPKTRKELHDYQLMIYNAMGKINTKVAERTQITLGKEIDSDWLKSLESEFELALKEISAKISRTKAAKDFFNRILSLTGDGELAVRLSTSVYGEDGTSLEAQIRNQVEALVSSTSAVLDPSVFFPDGAINPRRLRAFANEQAEALGGIESKAYQQLLRLSDDAEKDFAKTVEGWLKSVEKTKSYSDKILDLRRKTRSELSRIDSEQQRGSISPALADSLRAGFLKKEAEKMAALQYEAFKDSPMYVQMFDDLDHASTRMLENMRSRIENLKGEWKNLDPRQLKEMQSRLNEIDQQLAKRNPFRSLSDAIRDYRRLMREGDSRGNHSAAAADADLMKWAAEAKESEQVYQQLLHDDAATKEEIAIAKSRLDLAMSNEQAAQKAVENWKKVRDAINLSASELFDMLGWAGDIAHAVADISAAMGADEEDVQYWNDIASALDDISGGIQDIVSAAMSGNVVGIVSSTLTALPKMIVGFSNLFHAGRIRKANKEIRRQQELLDRLAYTYSRLESLAEKAFGADYVSNIKQQQRILQAQADAYLKQAEAERSKGKKADKEKIKEYEEAYRDTMDAIADMQGEISAKMLGADLTSAARDFAQAWLDAYREFGNTADKMAEKFRDMVNNMVVEGALSRVMERALRPMFDMIDSMNEEDFYDQSFWKRVVAESQRGADAANAGASTMMKFLEQAGIQVHELGSELTGISRTYATASEESVSGLAAATNTQNYYMDHIDDNVQHIRSILESRRPENEEAGTFTDLLEIERTSMAHLSMIERNTAETVAQCRRVAVSCESMEKFLKQVIDHSGGSPKFRIKM